MHLHQFVKRDGVSLDMKEWKIICKSFGCLFKLFISKLFSSKDYKKYLEKYEKKLQLKCEGKELEKIAEGELDDLENKLKLESIFDARYFCKEIIKVSFYA